MQSDKQCPKCGGVMQEGFIPDYSHHNFSRTAKWQSGEPQKSFWYGINTRDSPQYEIKSHRCTGGGYLESYAQEEKSPIQHRPFLYSPPTLPLLPARLV